MISKKKRGEDGKEGSQFLLLESRQLRRMDGIVKECRAVDGAGETHISLTCPE